MKIRAFKKFIYWIKERISIRTKKEAGEPWPWTKDKILQEYKFTNVFRNWDAVTIALHNKVDMTRRTKLDDLFFQIVLFRMFNWPPTYDLLRGKWDKQQAIRKLRKAQKNGIKIFTGAYIITNNGLKKEKIVLVCEAVDAMYKSRKQTVSALVNLWSIEEAARYLTRYPMVGKFIAYELVTDLRHTEILKGALDIFSWANPGPGAKRGLNRIWGRELKFTQADSAFVREIQLLLPNVQDNIPSRGFEMRDIEHSLCEFDKYMRVFNGEGRPRSKYRRPK